MIRVSVDDGQIAFRRAIRLTTSIFPVSNRVQLQSKPQRELLLRQAETIAKLFDVNRELGHGRDGEAAFRQLHRKLLQVLDIGNVQDDFLPLQSRFDGSLRPEGGNSAPGKREDRLNRLGFAQIGADGQGHDFWRTGKDAVDVPYWPQSCEFLH